MILGAGTDIMDVARVKEKLENDPGLRDELFTPDEINYCEAKAHKFQHYTARFAAKEAFLKAMGTGWQFGIRFVHIEITNNELGQPNIFLYDKAKDFAKEKGISKIHVSLAHVKDYALAYVIIEGEGG